MQRAYGRLASFSLYILIIVSLAGMMPLSVAGQNSSATLELRPHCESATMENVFGGSVPDNPFMTTPATESCAVFEVRDPQTRQTTPLASGDTLDMDLVVRNPGAAAVTRVRAWLAYDPILLEGQQVEITPSFTMPSPDEQGFSPADGYVKIGASAGTPLTATTIVVARIRMRVQSASDSQTIISFHSALGASSNETAVMTGQAGAEQSILAPPLGSLLVHILGSQPRQQENAVAPPDTAASRTSSTGSAGTSSPAPSPSPLPALPGLPPLADIGGSPLFPPPTEGSPTTGAIHPGNTFILLQIQNLRATTDGTTLYLAWDPLSSAELIGYNVSYGAISGEYIQRRSMDRSSTTLSIRNLPQDVRYYAAVRGVNGKNQETEFSHEVAVIIGRPQTSTSPLLASDLPQGPRGIAPRTGGTVSGTTGIPSTLLLFLFISAGIGTLLAMRRQFGLPHRSP